MRSTLKNSINKYLRECLNGRWVYGEAYKFEFANYVNNNVDWRKSDREILRILKESQRIKYHGETKGVQFIQLSDREKRGNFIDLNDIPLLRQVKEIKPENIDWKDRSMSYPVLSAWIASLFPDKFYPVARTGFNVTCEYLFDTGKRRFPKKGFNYILECQPFLRQTEEILSKYPVEELHLEEWNSYYSQNPDLNISPKDRFSKVDWVWLSQDFHFFVQQKVLKTKKTKKQRAKLQETDEEIIAKEGPSSKLAYHKQQERNSKLIKRVKEKAIKDDRLFCEVCGFSFQEIYGEIGEGFIEAHHKFPVSTRTERKNTTENDIALVCSNCHSMLHKGDPIYSLDELKGIINKNDSTT